MIPTLAEDALARYRRRLAEADAALPTGGDPRRAPTHHREAGRIQILRLRQAIADRRGDTDGFIALESAAAARPREPGGDRPAAAPRRAAGRGAGLDPARAGPGSRIATRADLIAGFDPRGPERERQALEIAILDALGRPDEAQALRWARFERDLDAPMLRAYLAKLPDFEDEEALLRALDHAEAFPQPHRALAFLTAWPDLNRAARLVTARPHDLAGRPVRGAGARRPTPSPCTTRSPRRSSIAACSTTSSKAVAAPPTPHGARYLAELDGSGRPAGRRRRSAPRADAYRADAAARARPQARLLEFVPD